MTGSKTGKPYGGAITRFFEEEAPDVIREAVENGSKKDILSADYPYDTRMKRDEYENTLEALQIELVKFQGWVKDEGMRVLLIFEGRDAAGKGGAISRIRMNLNSRNAKVIALSKPTETEASQWYFQRYVDHLPAGGEITIFDRSWYNRGVVEQVFGFVDHEDRERFFHQVPKVERMLVEDGVILRKIWLNVGRAEQLRRMLSREGDPLKQWKLSQIDVDGLGKWDAYSDAITETFARTHTEAAPWRIIRADDKRRARIATIRAVLSGIDYDGKDSDLVHEPNPKIAGGPEMWTDGTAV